MKQRDAGLAMLALGFALGLALAMGPGITLPALAQGQENSAATSLSPGAPAPGAAEVRLDDLTDALRRNQAHTEKLKSEIGQIAADRAQLNQRLIETARRVQAGEDQLEQAEIRLQRLADRRRIIKGSLASRHKLLAELLAALQKIGRAPPPAIVVQPQDALAAIRSAMLLGIIVPELRDEAARLAADLSELTRLQQAIAAETASLARSTAALAEERVRIEALIESRQMTLQAVTEQFEEARKSGEQLARETASLKDLIRKMDEAVGKAAGPDALSAAPEALAPGERRLAFSDPGRMRPAMAFTDARGLLPLPVSGTLQHRFGEEDGLGGNVRGVSIATRTRAQVISPTDGWVVYAGPFRSYGELLIINAGGGYHVILAGMNRVSAQLGQFVLAGEPVGIMGATNVSGQIIQASDQADRPVLYVEFRKDGASIDPGPWWTSAEQEVRG